MPILNTIGTLSIEEGGEHLPSTPIGDYVVVVDTTKITSTLKTVNCIVDLKSLDGTITINWGDGSSISSKLTGRTLANFSHNYGVQGEYRISVSSSTGYLWCNIGNGSYRQAVMPGYNAFAMSEDQSLISIESWGNHKFHTMSSMLTKNINLISIPTVSPNLTECSDLSSLFCYSSSFNQSLNSWNVSNVTNMNSIFANATSFNGDISGWDVSNVTNMAGMFSNATSFNGDISGWKVSRVKDMTSMFTSTPFNQDISNWDVTNVTSMDSMFSSATQFNRDLSFWCVKNILVKPNLFDHGAMSWVLPQPSWGNCPIRGLGIDATSVTFIAGRTTNTRLGEMIGRTNPITYSLSPALPAGLIFNTTNATITGSTLLLLSSTTFTLRATDSAGITESKNISIDIISSLSVTTALPTNSLFSGDVVTSLIPVIVSGNIGTTTYSISPALPTGLTFNTSTGAISGTPTSYSSTTSYTVTIADSVTSKSATFSLSVAIRMTINNPYAGLLILLNSNNTGQNEITGIEAAKVSGGYGNITYSIWPTLPSQMTLDTSTGIINCGPTLGIKAAVTYTITAKDEDNQIVTTSIKLQVYKGLTAVPTAVSFNYEAGKTIPTQKLLTISGGYPALAAITNVTPDNNGNVPNVWPEIRAGKYTYTVMCDTFPKGVTLDTSGIISGIAETAGSVYSLYVTDMWDVIDVDVDITFRAPLFTAAQVYGAKVTQLIVGTKMPTTYFISATGGVKPYTFSISPSLPEGIILDTATGALSGTPTIETAKITYNYTIRDNLSQIAQGSFLYTVLSVANTAFTATTPVKAFSWKIGQTISTDQLVNVSGGIAPYSYTIYPDLPAGLTLNSSSGVISGISTAYKESTNYDVTVYESGGSWYRSVISLFVDYSLEVTSVNDIVMTAGMAITPTQSAIVTGSSGTLTYSVIPALPAGLLLNSATGIISGTPTAYSPTTSYTIKVNDTKVTRSTTLQLTVNYQDLVVTKLIDPVNCYVGKAMNSGSLISISGGSGKYWISTRGDVATGLTFRLGEGNTDSTLTATANYYSSNIVCYINGTLGQLTGSSGSYTLPITVSCSDSSISPVTVRTTINYLYTDIVVTKYPSIHLNRVVAQKFSFATLIVTGGKAPYSFAMSPSTPLPTGMALDSSTGIISGQVTTANNISSSHTINMKTADGQTASCDFTIAITVEPSVTAITTSSTVQAYVGTFTTFTPVSGNNGLPPYVYSISPSVNSYYPGLTFDSTTGTISGTPISGSSTGNFRVTVTDRMNYAAAGDFVFKLSPAIFATTKISSKSMIVGIAETFTPVIGSGGKIPYAYSVSPSLPNGLSIDSATGTISGIPTITYNIGSTPFTITITDDNNATSSSSFRIGISAALAITSSITDQILFVGYTNIFTPVTASGGKAPYSYTISPALPTGLSMDSVTSTITATATSTLSNTSYTITATDSLGYTKTAPLQLKIYNRLSSKYSASNYTGSINKSLSVAAPTTTGGSGTGYTYSISPMLPATLIFNTSTGAISGTPTAGLTSTYYTISVKDSINLTTITAVFLGVLNITVGGFTGTSYIIRATTTTIGGSGNYTYLVIGNGGSGGPTAAVSSAGTISITRGSKSKATYTGSITVTDTTYNISVQVNFTYTI